MSSPNKELLSDLKSRGLVAQMTSEQIFEEFLSANSCTLYCGFDPTADSLHIGSLVPLLTLKRFQAAGHKPLALVGGATGLIGDPSGKSEERNLNTPDIVAGWGAKIKNQVSRFLEFDCGANSAEVVNNLEWTQGLGVLEFLRGVGKHFSVNNMINKESVKQRFDREGAGISYTEFTYMILQSMDFAELYKKYNCRLQIGGSDQWGNITGGVDLARRLYGGQVFGLTLPLVTKADGTKFGKTESGTVWLDPVKTSPYSFYQFWLNTADADVYKFLRYFTFLSIEQIDSIERLDKESGGRPGAQRVLAEEVTRLVHGADGLAAAERITRALFSGEISVLTESDYEQLAQDGLPCSRVLVSDFAKPLTSLLSDLGLAKAKEIKDALARSAVFLNEVALGLEHNMRAAECLASDKAAVGRFFLVRLGKKKHHLIDIG